MFKLAVSIQETQVVCKSHLSFSLCLEYLVKISLGEGRCDNLPTRQSFLLYYNSGERVECVAIRCWMSRFSRDTTE